MKSSSFAALTDALSGHSGLRRAALLLHGLHPADRDLLMDDVGVDDRQRLLGLLQELDALGIPAAQAHEGLAALPAPAAVVAVGNEFDADWLSRADVRAVCDVLAGEPDTLIARVLRLNAWCWKAKLLDSLGSERRTRVGELLLDPANRYRDHTRLDAALLHQLRVLVQHRAALLATPPPLMPATRSASRGLWGLWRGRWSGSVA